MKKIKNLCVATSKYQSNGQEKTNWQTVGGLMQDDNGRQFLILQRTFNPAGVPNPDNKDVIYVSMFDIKKDVDKSSSGDKMSSDDNSNIPF